MIILSSKPKNRDNAESGYFLPHPKLIRPRSASICRISTSIISPTFSVVPKGILDLCSSPSCLRPMSTNAPKSTTLRTVPFRLIPVVRSSTFSTSERRMGAGVSVRGSRPGRTSCSRMSFRVGMPHSNSADKIYRDVLAVNASRAGILSSIVDSGGSPARPKIASAMG